ncbi:uncharacterized protein LOC121919087 [Sceloporus undulatus]|uniref:uncharacterized protein LOC121919087 n=1 Tax=Sceloporus undulatus TaxID=8520 RepID=UPI001C4D422D|nr:uncharacterized protein LOC121919087 [Sceloporus undulatus]
MQGPDPEEGPVLPGESSLWGPQEEEEEGARPPRAKGRPQEEEDQAPFSLRSLLPSWLRSNSPQEHPNHQEPSGSRSGSAVDRVTICESTGSLESILQVLRESSHPMVKEFLQAQETQFRIFAHLLHENEQLKCNWKASALQPSSERQHWQQRHTEEAQMSERQHCQQRYNGEVQIFQPPGETQPPQQEHWETKKNHKPGLQKSSHQKWSFPWSNTDFLVQVLTTGKTGGCEKQFLDGVSKHLSYHRINLQVDSYEGNSSRFLLVFCPIASRIGTDIENALEGLSSSVSKTLLVVLHHKPKDSHHLFVDTKLQGQHRALVRTVHARYTVQDGLYACQMNEEAMADVAKVIKDLSREG